MTAYDIIMISIIISILVRVFDKGEYLYHCWKHTQVTADTTDFKNIVINVGNEVDLTFKDLKQYKEFIRNNEKVYVDLCRKQEEGIDE